MIGENRQLVTDEPVEEVEDYWKITGHLIGVYIMSPKLIKESRRM